MTKEEKNTGVNELELRTVVQTDDNDELPALPPVTQTHHQQHQVIISIDEAALDELRAVTIKGSFHRSLLSNIFLAYIARSSMTVHNATLPKMTNLAQTPKNILAVTTLLAAMMMPIPVTWLVHQSGGKFEVLLKMSISAVGMLGLSITAKFFDLSAIKEVDGSYLAVFCSTFLIGYASAAPFLMTDTLKWAPNKKLIPKIQTLASFFIDSASVTTPILINYLKSDSYFNPLISFTAISLFSIGVSLWFFQPSPYIQYKAAFSNVKARQYAEEYGQLGELIGEQDKYSFSTILKANFGVFYDRRAIPLVLTFFSALGISWFTRLLLPGVLVNGFGLQPDEAIVVSSLAFLVAILSRPIAELMIKKWDNESGGVRVHLLGCLLTIAGGISLINTIPRWALYFSLGVFNVGFGINLVTPASIGSAWSMPANKTLKDFNPSNMYSLFGTLGTLGSIILPFFLSLIVEQTGQEGYRNFFYLLVALIAVSAVLMPIIDSHVRDTRSKTLCGRLGAFFTHSESYREDDEEIPAQRPPAERIHVENTFFY